MRVSASEPTLVTPTARESELTPQSPSREEAPSSFAQVLRGLGQELGRGETTVRSAIVSMRGGADLGPAQLIALQVGVYRYSEVIDLASRLVDRASSAVKTVVQGGGQ
jgi:hypothetical protein